MSRVGSVIKVSRQEYAILEKFSKYRGCRVWEKDFYTYFKTFFKILGCDMAGLFQGLKVTG